MNSKSTNLQMTRFFAALLVIFSHSFMITQGKTDGEWLYEFTNGQFNFGALAVAIFFLCGGYLAARSAERKVSLKKYLFGRLGRILPALMFVVISSIIVGMFISTLTVKEYLTNSMTYKYLLNMFLILQHELPGVFQEAKYVPTVNGALWTLPVEFLCNIACYLLGRIGFLKKEKFKWTMPVVAVGSIGIYILGTRITILLSLLRPCLLFYVGMSYWVYNEKIKYELKYAIVGLVMLLGIAYRGALGGYVLNIAIVLLFPYVMMTFWFGTKQRFEKLSKLGDYSYSMYLWGFPVQQFVAERFNWSMSPYLNTILSGVIVFVLAVLTYHLIEVPMGRWSKKCAKLL